MFSRASGAMILATAVLLAACSNDDAGVSASDPAPSSTTTTSAPSETASDPSTTAAPPTTIGSETTTTASSTAEPTTAPTTAADTGSAVAQPDWLGTRTLPTRADGSVEPQETPPELSDRRLVTVDTLPSPGAEPAFTSTEEPLADNAEALARSTWVEGCPVGPDELTYATVTFWGFDDRAHQGELILHSSVASDVVGVFAKLYDARFPIEEMRVVTQADLDAPPTGDGNNTSSFVCRAVVGGSRFSEHASGLAVDINPFHNPYEKGDLVLPELATTYVDRSAFRPGMIVEGDVVVQAFDEIGWGWGGRWDSLKDYQHFSLNNR